MTIEQIKEELSNSFIGLVASYLGYKLTKPSDTGGVDYSLTKDVSYISNGKTRFIQSGQYVDLQLKATTDKTVILENNVIKYDLEVKTYNDLIKRKEFANAPFFLILFILPEEQNDWIDFKDEYILLRKYAFWYIPPDGSKLTNNASKIRISIPLQNKLDFDTFDNWFKTYYN